MTGNTLAEYGLSLGLILVALLSSGVLLGAPKDLLAFFAGTTNAMKNTSGLQVQSLGSLPAGTTVPGGSSTSASPTSGVPVSASGTSAGPNNINVTITLSSGQQVQLTMPNNLGQPVETSGANGTTTLLLSALEQLAQDMQAAGAINAVQASSLKDLANQGHRIAEIERTIEDFAAGLGPGDQMGSASIMFEWMGYNKDILAREVSSGGSEMRHFKQLYQDAVDQGALNDPAAKAVVEQLVSYIELLGNAFYDATFWADNAKELNERTAGTVSQKTDLSSSSICATGGGTDSGIQCS